MRGLKGIILGKGESWPDAETWEAGIESMTDSDRDIEMIRDWLLSHLQKCAVNNRATYGPCNCGLRPVAEALDRLATRLVAAEEERDTLLAKKDLYEQVVGSKADLLMRLRTLEGRAIELGAARRLIQELEEENEQLWGVVKDVGMLLAADPPSDGYLARNLRKMGPHIEAAFALHKEAERDREETT